MAERTAEWVLAKMTTLLARDWWEGIPWSWVVQVPEDQRRGGRPSFVVAGGGLSGWHVPTAFALIGPEVRDRHPWEAELWDAFTLWAAWAAEVAKGQGFAKTPAEWLIFTTYPGRREPVPRAWIRAAQTVDPEITWKEWKLACGLMAKGVVAMNRPGMVNAVSLIRSGVVNTLTRIEAPAEAEAEAEESGTPPPPGRGRGRRFQKLVDNWPREWEVAFAATVRGLSPRSANTYRSTLRRIVREAGSHDVTKCGIAASRSTHTLAVTVWGRFSRHLFGTTVPEVTPAKSTLPAALLRPPILRKWEKDNRWPAVPPAPTTTTAAAAVGQQRQQRDPEVARFMSEMGLKE